MEAVTDDDTGSSPAGHVDYQKVYIDAGITTVNVEFCSDDNSPLATCSFPSHKNLNLEFSRLGLLNPENSGKAPPTFITGSLQHEVKRVLGYGKKIVSSSALWLAASELSQEGTTAIIEISASGYNVIGVEAGGESLQDYMFTTNPRCGSGCGVNLDRILMKLGISAADVDDLLNDYQGETGKSSREDIFIRADRCGVFSSSATISDKNQGIPVDFALATTMKSEVVKACSSLRGSFDQVLLTGGVFRWQFARDCAFDYLISDYDNIEYRPELIMPIVGMKRLDRKIGYDDISQGEESVLPSPPLLELPSFTEIRDELFANNSLYRLDNPPLVKADFTDSPIWLGLDVGSTMAKVSICDAGGSQLLFQSSYSNAGDTVETVKAILNDLLSRGHSTLHILGIGITGSARYQVEKSLHNSYPELVSRTMLLVENYAHAMGAIDYAKEHIDRLKRQGIEDVNEEFCLLIDVGGEDTKVTSISLAKEELFDNAMNIKCSAGTGSLIDTVVSLFALSDVAVAAQIALTAEKGFVLNATCAIFLLENARKLQSQGVPTDQILASAHWAIVENMARSLWPQIDIPANTVVLLHGQPMLSEPLPVAIAHRLGEHQQGHLYSLVPPFPGHRACHGLINQMLKESQSEPVSIDLSTYCSASYNKKIIQCRGVACGDKDACCNRSHVSTIDPLGNKLSFVLGGCTPVNERQAGKRQSGKRVDAYGAIWRFIDDQLPRSTSPERLVIPRAFALSEWTHFFAGLFSPYDIPVHVDNVIEADIHAGKSHFQIDSCAPHIGAVGQIIRLAQEPHECILLPQIEFLPVDGGSLGRSCTINQGGLAVARGLAQQQYPESSIHLFHIDLKSSDSDMIAQKLYPRLQKVYAQYGVEVGFEQFRHRVASALQHQGEQRRLAADFAAELVQAARQAKTPVVLVIGREYILNPGVYDSHIGRLLGDKGIVGIPAYLLDVEAVPKFNHLYWRNAHIFATVTDAATKGKLHRVTRHVGLKAVFAEMENSDSQTLPIVQISTFQCGPDSVTTPLLEELSLNRPFLKIQSDAILKELAHLENRVNTFLRQLDLGLHDEFIESRSDFDIEVLEDFINTKTLSPKGDVIAFPTLGDNRLMLSIIRGAGFSTIDTFSDDFKLEESIEKGRRVAGDAVCAPLAGVYGDMLFAVEELKRQRRAGNPEFVDKKRLLFFNSKGLGPCRQGQYVEAHKLFLFNRTGAPNRSTKSEFDVFSDDILLQFLVGNENKGMNIGLPLWAYLRGIQAVVLQGVMQQLLATGSVQCADAAQYKRFIEAYRSLNRDLMADFENRLIPSAFGTRMISLLGSIPVVGWLTKFFGWRFHDPSIQQRLKRFSNKWCKIPVANTVSKIHIDGETYMRVAQFDGLLRELVGIFGFRRFALTHTPVWAFLEYKIAGMLMRATESIDEGRQEIARAHSEAFATERKRFVRGKRKRLLGLRFIHWLLRRIIAAPLYRAASVPMPEPMPKVLDQAKVVIPTRRPGGELVPYVGEVRLKLREGADLVLNIAPEGCMVSSMGEVMTPAIIDSITAEQGSKCGNIVPLFSQYGDVDREALSTALLKTLGPERFYSPTQRDSR